MIRKYALIKIVYSDHGLLWALAFCDPSAQLRNHVKKAGINDCSHVHGFLMGGIQ